MPKPASYTTLFVLVLVERDGRKYHAYAPGLKGLHVDGKTREQTVENAKNAVSVYLNSLSKSGEKIPVGPYLKADYVRIDKEIIPDDPGLAFLQSFQWPFHSTSGTS